MRILKIKEHETMGLYKITSVDLIKDRADILIDCANGGSWTVSVKDHVEISPKGIKKRYDNGKYEITSKKLEQLKKEYTVVMAN